MTVPTVSCTNCGKNFTTDDLRGTSCRFCGTVLAHHARAAQQVAVVNQMLADHNGNGIPDAYEGLVANAQQNAMNQVFGQPFGVPYGAPGPVHGMHQPMAPQVHVAHMGNVAEISRTVSKVATYVVVGVIGAVILMIGLGVALVFLLV